MSIFNTGLQGTTAQLIPPTVLATDSHLLNFPAFYVSFSL